MWRDAKNDGEDGPLLRVEEVCTPFERGKWPSGTRKLRTFILSDEKT